jgi:hypothetical protein
VLLCRHHHRLVYEGGWHLDPHGRFSDRWGRPLPAVPQLPRGHPDELVAGQGDLGIGARTCQLGTGEPMDLACAVAALLSLSSRPAARGRVVSV